MFGEWNICIRTDSHFQLAHNHNGYLHCILPNKSHGSGIWYKPNEIPVNCEDVTITDPFLCLKSSVNESDSNVSLYMYLQDDDDFVNGWLHDIEMEYKCCLPNNCSDPTLSRISINIFGRYIIIIAISSVLTAHSLNMNIVSSFFCITEEVYE